MAFFTRAWWKVKVLPCPWPWWLQLHIDETFQMRYIMSLNSHWFQKYKPSKLNNEKTSVLVLKRTGFFIVQVWRTAILKPVGVQRHNVPNFKGLIVHYLDSRSSRAWQHFYLLPLPFEKGHFKLKKGYCAVSLAPCCMYDVHSVKISKIRQNQMYE